MSNPSSRAARSGIRAVDTMVTLPQPKTVERYAMVQGSLGQNAGDPTVSPVAYLFRDAPTLPEGADPIDHTLAEMDRFDIEHSVVDIGLDPSARLALEKHPDRFIGITSTNPHEGMDGIRALERAHRELGVRGTTLGAGPAFLNPPVAIDDRRMYPIYAKCVELDIAVFITVGVPGPRVPMAAQRVELLDEVCWFFPELRIVMRHGAEPWDDLAVKLMLKWPNLYYSTSAFAPRRYPKTIIDYANSRGSEKILFAGYYAVGLTWDRVFSDFDAVPFRDAVWQNFLRDNALRVLGVGA
jgi:predicted TIM-barrel fold metal-dependent hydrolase